MVQRLGEEGLIAHTLSTSVVVPMCNGGKKGVEQGEAPIESLLIEVVNPVFPDVRVGFARSSAGETHPRLNHAHRRLPARSTWLTVQVLRQSRAPQHVLGDG